ncbi:MAG: hypothetical protein ACNI25_09190 [Halarcobacter sp.]
MEKRKISEFIPLTMAFLSGVIFFNWKSEWIDNIQVNFMLMALIVIIFLTLSIIYGNFHIKKYGKNIVIWLGVTLSSLLALIQVFILFIGATWNGIF